MISLILDHVRQGLREAYSCSSTFSFTFFILPMIPSSITGRPFSLLPPTSLPPPSLLQVPSPLPSSLLLFSVHHKKQNKAYPAEKNSKRKQALTDEKHHLPLTAPPSSLSSPSQRGK